MTPPIHERIQREFPAADQAHVTAALDTYTGPEAELIHSAVLELSKGSLAQVRHFLKAAAANPRDILYWAEYYATDPALTNKDPRELVKSLVDRWAQP